MRNFLCNASGLLPSQEVHFILYQIYTYIQVFFHEFYPSASAHPPGGSVASAKCGIARGKYEFIIHISIHLAPSLIRRYPLVGLLSTAVKNTRKIPGRRRKILINNVFLRRKEILHTTIPASPCFPMRCYGDAGTCQGNRHAS